MVLALTERNNHTLSTRVNNQKLSADIRCLVFVSNPDTDFQISDWRWLKTFSPSLSLSMSPMTNGPVWRQEMDELDGSRSTSAHSLG